MSLRLKLLLLGLATLVLPWAGCRYAREMESALREGEADSLQAVAQTIATSLQGRTDLLYRETPAAPEGAPAEAHADSAQGGSVAPPESATDPDFFKPTPYDLEPVALTAAPLLDGYAEDWPRDPAAWTHFDQDAQHRFAVVTGVHERMLYVAARGARRAPAVRGSRQQLSGACHLR